MNSAQEFYCRRLAALTGGTITGPAATPDGFVGLAVCGKDGKTRILWILQDDEGNGPGSFEIDEA